MMKHIFRKIASLLMAFVVLCSTMSFTIDMHYCGNTLMDSSVFQKAKTCGMEMPSAPSKDCAITKSNCCTDKQLSVDGQDDLQQSVSKISLEQQVFLVSFMTSYLNLFTETTKEDNFYRAYAPPLVSKQIYKLDETYLI
ncbi:CHASE3 domain sensor protein [Wenyingzhuangia aestuarii]|uniref:HYC_CC_PP family protein n=1 Tax=Wenyingzhuangia aestuarii TaxID=1647582 RepID=UPI00293BF1F7|nr:hypothetical protein [Wenyingzhuangia aestuarii]NJB84110.1 CHASE3 domain sensor protein [Wenyingzhuangia aestuarii]